MSPSDTRCCFITFHSLPLRPPSHPSFCRHPHKPRFPVATAAPSSSRPSANTLKNLFACPVCFTPISPLDLRACPSCATPFKRTADYYDLTPPISLFQQIADDPLRQQMFRTFPVSWLYERGWRDSFKQMGFPGADKEFEMAMQFFRPNSTQTLVDLSCGSGLATRRFAKSGEFGKVLAVDYSENMLKETAERMRKENLEFQLIRAAAESLPFRDESIDFVHVGAALHCWNRLQDGLKQVERVLKKGGKFFATTILYRKNSPPMGNAAFRYFQNEQELVYLMKAAGFGQVQVESNKQFAVVRCEKAPE